MGETENNFVSSNSTFQDDCNGDAVLDLQYATAEKISSLMYSTTERLIILTLYPVSLIIGLTGNIGFLVVLACIPKMRTITNFYLGNLAVADATFLCILGYDVLLGYILSPDVKMKPYLSSFGCSLSVVVKYMSHIASVGLIFLVTMERYYGICKPLQHRMIVAKGRTFKLVATAWFVGLIFAALVVPKSASFKSTCIIWPQKPMYEHLPMRMKSCNSVMSFFNTFQAIVLAFPLATVLLINTIMYVKIVQELSSRVAGEDKTKSAIAEAAAIGAQARRVRNQVARLLIATGTFFFFCCVPEFILRLNGVALTLSASELGFKMTPRQRWVVVWLARGLTTINAVVNPIIYSLTNAGYRKAFVHVFSCGCVRGKMLQKSDAESSRKAKASNSGATTGSK